MYANMSTLKLVQVFFRHGDRGPIPNFELYPNDPHLNNEFHPGNAQLTKNGEVRTRKLANFLAEKYREFLKGKINSRSIAARTTCYQRTRESLKIVLDVLAPGINVRVKEVPLKDDSNFFPQMLATYSNEYDEILTLPDVKDKMKTFEDLMKRLSDLTGKKMETARDLVGIYMTFEVEHFFGLELPDWANDMYPDGELKTPASYEYEIMNYTDTMKKLNGGPLLEIVIGNMQGTESVSPELVEVAEAAGNVPEAEDKGTNGTIHEDRKMLLYSVHDTHIAALLIAMGVFYPHIPQFTCAVIFELHLIREVYHVKVLYYLGEPSEILELMLPGREIVCPLEQFVKHVENYMPNQYVDRTLNDVHKVLETM